MVSDKKLGISISVYLFSYDHVYIGVDFVYQISWDPEIWQDFGNKYKTAIILN